MEPESADTGGDGDGVSRSPTLVVECVASNAAIETVRAERGHTTNMTDAS